MDVVDLEDPRVESLDCLRHLEGGKHGKVGRVPSSQSVLKADQVLAIQARVDSNDIGEVASKEERMVNPNRVL